MSVAIVDFGLGNLTSVAGAIHRVGGAPVVTSNPDEIATCDRIILPGVGAFRDGMANLHQRGLVDCLNRLVLKEKLPVLGICLGFQLLATRSSEFGETSGLGWIEADVDRINVGDADLRVPHVGWNEFTRIGDPVLFTDVPDDTLFYYVHSYRLSCRRPCDVAGTVDYGESIVASVRRDNIFGTQFHPEKSQKEGLKVLQNFLSV